MENQVPSSGRIVHYRLSKEDAEQIMQRRSVLKTVGNMVAEGQTFPMIIIRTWGDTPESCVNGQVMLDGDDHFWATSVSVGEGPRTYSWPKRV